MAIAQFCVLHGIGQGDVAKALGVTPSAVSRKLNGLRKWTRDEIDSVLSMLSERLGHKVTYEEAFGPADVDDAPPEAPDEAVA
jgi:predicted transcriptional regulator